MTTVREFGRCSRKQCRNWAVIKLHNEPRCLRCMNLDFQHMHRLFGDVRQTLRAYERQETA